ncbi:hypothetical protein L1I30_03080 [Gillisia sp. M10.2A]|uniref:Uncharacterized protein n=1 Tax=Gillisia lutea TaxID=2909668 RepID=A0ABS9ECN1_9FLAO|nr:DUF4175 family protein [Gillisia lutea]MCF4100641.1 hypothetical protein [Gillisia lutea]
MLTKFIVIPVLQLFKLSKGLDFTEASKIIGIYFPEVNDKLLNVLQLQESSHQSDLLLASIAQKSKELQPIPFKLAIDYRKSLRLFKYAVFPITFILLIFFTGNSTFFSDSYTRVIHYKTQFEPPALFSFLIETDSLKIEEGKEFELKVNTHGKVVPENVSIHYNGETYYMKSDGIGSFSYIFPALSKNTEFYFSSNEVRSQIYSLAVIDVPQLLNFEVLANYPAYTGMLPETFRGSGNITIPEGSKVTWKLGTKSTNKVSFETGNSSDIFNRDGDNFSLSKVMFNDMQYSIHTSNTQISNYENLNYNISVVKDEAPTIEVISKLDSVDLETLYFRGKLADDYGVSKLNLVYYIEDEIVNKRSVSIPFQKTNISDFLYVFPGDIPVDAGSKYHIYFEVYDNDGIHGSKTGRSEIFTYRGRTKEEVEDSKLTQQGESIQNLSKSLNTLEFSESELDDLSQQQRQKSNLSFTDRKKLSEFLKRQQQQSEMMKKYSDELRNNLPHKNEGENDEFKEELKQRLERSEERAKSNEELLKELQEISDKINKEDLLDKLDKLAKNNSSDKRNLEQLLELTKQYYVQEKTQKLARDLDKLAQDQEELSKADSSYSKEAQELVSDTFQEFKKEMDSLELDNKKLNKPTDIKRDKVGENIVEEEQKNAENHLGSNNNEARSSQEKAAKKMKELAKKLENSQSLSSGAQLLQNIEGMRQVLDNLMVFSFEQESSLESFKNIRINNPSYAGELRNQQILKEHFQHIDDSLFSLALSNPMINEKITSKIVDIQFNIDKALERLSQNELSLGTSSQQYVMTTTNELAYLLDNILENMESKANLQMSPGAGPGGIQLKDIIQKQEEIGKAIEKGVEKDQESGISKSGNEGEDMNGKIFEIYKRQNELRESLKRAIDDNNLGEGDDRNVLTDLELLEKEILDKGFNKESLKRISNIQHKLMDLEKAVKEQEEESARTSQSNLNEFNKSTQDQIIKAKEYLPSIEILNRQVLPLRQIYKAKVRAYFNGIKD